MTKYLTIKKSTFTFLFALVLVFFSCENNSPEEREQVTEEVQNHNPSEEHQQDSSADQIQKVDEDQIVLNRGEKWEMSESLNTVVREMADDVTKFYRAKKTQMSDYHTLADTLDKGIQKLINKCELPDGEAHENLHKWLHPYMEEVVALKKVNNSEDARNKLEEIRQSFITYMTHFK